MKPSSQQAAQRAAVFNQTNRMAHRVARQLKGRAPEAPPALSPELFDLLCEMRLQLAAQQKQHAQLRQEMSAEVSSLWRAVLSGGTGKQFASGAAVQVPRLGGVAQPAAAASGATGSWPRFGKAGRLPPSCRRDLDAAAQPAGSRGADAAWRREPFR